MVALVFYIMVKRIQIIQNQWINDETALFLVNRLREWWNSCDYNCRITISRGKWIFWSEKKNEFESGSINNVELMQNLREIKVQMSHWTKNFFLFVCLIHKIKRREKKIPVIINLKQELLFFFWIVSNDMWLHEKRNEKWK